MESVRYDLEEMKKGRDEGWVVRQPSRIVRSSPWARYPGRHLMRGSTQFGGRIVG